ncbi:MAG: hypothetical protein ACKVWR_17455 [Acidimicrobiales bacterium]
MSLNDDTGVLAGCKVVDPHGETVGAVATVVYDDDAAAAPSWVVVSYGPFKTKKTLVPLADAHRGPDGALVVAYDKAVVRGGPRTGPNPTSAERAAALSHYDPSRHSSN